MTRALSAVFVFICTLGTGCSRGAPAVTGDPTPAVKAETRSELGLPCKARRAPPGTETEYSCPDATTAARCAAGDAIACSPKGRARGAIAPGGKCVHVTGADSAKFELGDDCAPHVGTASPESPKGSYCVMESGPGAYCTHFCGATSDCADLRREGFVAECFGGFCALRQG